MQMRETGSRSGAWAGEIGLAQPGLRWLPPFRQRREVEVAKERIEARARMAAGRNAASVWRSPLHSLAHPLGDDREREGDPRDSPPALALACALTPPPRRAWPSPGRTEDGDGQKMGGTGPRSWLPCPQSRRVDQTQCQPRTAHSHRPAIKRGGTRGGRSSGPRAAIPPAPALRAAGVKGGRHASTWMHLGGRSKGGVWGAETLRALRRTGRIKTSDELPVTCLLQAHQRRANAGRRRGRQPATREKQIDRENGAAEGRLLPPRSR